MKTVKLIALLFLAYASILPVNLHADGGQVLCWRESDGSALSTYAQYSNPIAYDITIITNKDTPTLEHQVTIYHQNSDGSTGSGIIQFHFTVGPGGLVNGKSFHEIVGTYTFGGDNFPYNAGDVNYQFPPTMDQFVAKLDDDPPDHPAPIENQINLSAESDFTYSQWYLTHGGIFSFLGQDGPYLQGAPAQVTKHQPVIFCLCQAPGQPPYCPSCGCSMHMPTATLDRYRAAIAITDTPVGYTPPVGRSMNFTINYYQRLDTQPTTFNFSNLGAQWQFGWVSYIAGGPTNDQTAAIHHQPDGSTMTYGNYHNVVTQGQGVQPVNNGDFMDNQAYTLATLHYRQGPERYERWLPDGTIEIFGQSVGTNPNRLFFLTSIQDPQGNITKLTYDPVAATNGNAVITSITDPQGNSLQFSYDNQDPLKITKVTRSLDGLHAQFQYSNGQLSSVSDTQGITTSFQYKASSTDLASMTTPYGTSTFNTSISAGYQEADITNPLGQNQRAEFVNSLDPSLYPAQESQAPSALNLSIKNAELNLNNSFYWDRRAMDQTNRTGVAIDSAAFYQLARVSHWAKSTQGPIPVAISTKNPLESRVWMNYQGQDPNNPDFISLTSANTMTNVSATARVLDDGTTQVSYATYNSNGLITQSVDPVGRTTQYTYAANSIDVAQISQKTSSGTDLLSTMTYNGLHEPLTSTDAAGQTTINTYNAAGQIVTSTDPKQETSTWTYNGDGTLQKVTRPAAGATTSYTYDVMHRVHTVTDSEGYALIYAYDSLDRQISTTYPDGTTDLTRYDNPTTPLDIAHTIDRQGRITTKKYDPIREIILNTDPLGRTTGYTWCTCGGLSTLTDANGHVTTWNLDLQGRVTGKIYADSTQITYTYETTTSRLKQMVDANGNSAVYAYNEDNTLAGTTYVPGSGVAATPNVSFTYDPSYNRINTMKDGTGTTTYAYNPVKAQLGANQLASLTSPINGTGQTAIMTYAYDPLGRVISRAIDGTTTNANTVSTTFDNLGRVTNTSNPLGAFTYAYVNTTSRLAEVDFPNWQKTTYGYYPNTGDQRLQEIKNYVYGILVNTPLSDFQYTYNPVGTIATWQQQADASAATVYNLSYDAADQLINAVQKKTTDQSTVTSNGYDYDPAGNRLAEVTLAGTSAGQFNTLNQLTRLTVNSSLQSVGGYTTQPAQTVTVNAVPASLSQSTNFVAPVPLPQGTNVVSVVAQDKTGTTTTQRVQVVTTAGSVPTPLTYDRNGNTLTDEQGYVYTWDALNRLISITYPTKARSLFAYDGLSRRVSIIEKDASGNLTSTKNYLWIGQEISEERDAQNKVTKRFFAQGEQQNGTAYFYTRDHLGSVREMCNSSDAIQARYTYDFYGRTTLVSGTNLATEQYAGYYAHQPSSLNLTLYRAYDVSTGRWLSRDPIGERGGSDLYDYVLNDPSNLVDPLGLLAPAPLPLVSPPPIPPPLILPAACIAGAIVDGYLIYRDVAGICEIIHIYREQCAREWVCYCRGQNEKSGKYITGVGRGKSEKEATQKGKEDVQRKNFGNPGEYVRHIKCHCYQD